MKGMPLPLSTESVAAEFAKFHFSGMKHRGGADAFDHSQRVAAQLSSPFLQAIAYLHDVVEDTPVTHEEIEKMFGPRIGNAVRALTRELGETWNGYIAKVMCNGDAVPVKIADIRDNLARMDQQMMKNSRNGSMYQEALDKLLQCVPTPAL